MNANEVKKDLYKSKIMAKFSHYVSGNLYYTVQLENGVYQFPIPTVEDNIITVSVELDHELFSGYKDVKEGVKLSEDLGQTTFGAEVKGSDLNRWITKAIDKGEFVKISDYGWQKELDEAWKELEGSPIFKPFKLDEE